MAVRRLAPPEHKLANARWAPAVACIGVVTSLLFAACVDNRGSAPGAKPDTPTLVTAPQSARVDLVEPTFTNPTSITNPRFPISELTQVVQLGKEAGDKLRFEVTTLRHTKVIEWNGKQVETRVSSFVAYHNGRVAEVALDYFAQADDGAVWYFGEDVTNYEDGAVLDHDGTWLAGRDGPPGMIMPADPKVGDVYRPENIPGFVFEEVTVQAVDQTVEGPRGPVEGAILIQELLMDGLLEDKTFAPGYGEFHFAVPAEEEVVDMALAVPTDALSAPAPAELTALSAGADEVFDAVPTGDWDRISATTESMSRTWDAYEDEAEVPELLETQMSDALAALDEAVDVRDASTVQQAAIDVAQASLDLQLQFRAPAEVDQARVQVWSQQLLLDQVVGDTGGVAGDRVILDAIRGRV